MFDVIERLKADWTDKYVVVNSPAPELARFAHSTGQVKTVNMNGRCLVEFDQYNNIGWYDIDPAALRVVPKPEPKPAAEKQEKPAKASPAAKAGPAKAAPAAGTKKPSTADILAAARGKGGAAPAAAKPAAGRPSTADILAAARGKKPAATPPAAEAPAEPEAASEPEAAQPEPKVAPKTKPAAGGALPTTTADKIAWCRTRDAKG